MSYSSFGSSGSVPPRQDKTQMMDQVRSQLAVVNAQELIQKMSEKCFKKCVTYIGTELDRRETNCLSNCVDRYMEAWNLVSKGYSERIQKEHGM